MSTSEHEDVKRLREHCEQLGEYFDSVQIFATRHDAGQEDGTVSVNEGAGNWFARYGQVSDWLLKREEQARLEVRKDET